MGLHSREGIAMMKNIGLIAITLGVAGGLFWAKPAIFPPKAIAAPPSQGMDVWQLEREASKTTTPSFDDQYQSHLGVLDVLRP